MVIKKHIGTIEVLLKYLSLKIGISLDSVGMHFCHGILHHHHTIGFIEVGEGKSLFGQSIEEALFCVEVIEEGAVIIKVVSSEVGKDTSSEIGASDTVLMDSVRRDLHKGILAACLYHLPEVPLKGEGIRGGELTWNLLPIHNHTDC
ncbi:unknown [Porphyromonas sp. CAG:1061]|nr:unknown [Porphyromonas sp. CAG:1061]